MSSGEFRFKQFTVRQERCAMKVSTDAVVLGAWADVDGAQRILDIGTGTGVLALMVAQRCNSAWIDAVEIDAEAAGQASENVAISPWCDRLRVHHMDVRRAKASERYDLIISNPPYYEGEMKPEDARSSIAKHGDELSFVGLMEMVRVLLSKTGRLAVIIPANREEALRSSAIDVGLHPVRRCVLFHLEGKPAKRVLLEFMFAKVPLQDSELIVEHMPGRYTEAYQRLLAPFMLNF